MVFNAHRAMQQDLLAMSLRIRKYTLMLDNLTMLTHYERLRKTAPRRLGKLERIIVDEQHSLDQWSDLAYELAELIGIDPADLAIYIARRYRTTLRLSE